MLYHLDDVRFLFGVDVGGIVNYKAYIVYVQSHLVHIKVVVYKIEPQKNLKKEKTTEMHLTFLCQKQLFDVYPKTY